MINEALFNFYSELRLESDLQKLIAERYQESIHVEFKKKKNRSTPELDVSDARQFSRALSGFANSDGGVLVWGIATDAEERAVALDPIAVVAEFQSRLKKSLLNATQPVVDGVLIDVVQSSTELAAGYVKCLIPPSDKVPHRGMLAEREYYKRSTEGFYRLEHFDLEDMFGRRPIPLLQLKTRMKATGSSGGGGNTRYRSLLVLAIENIGRGSARAPYLAVSVNQPYQIARYGIDGNGHEGLPRVMTADQQRVVYTSSDVAIHPGVCYEVAGIELEVGVDNEGNIAAAQRLEATCEIAAENARLRTESITLSAEELAKEVLPPSLRPR